MKPLYLVNPERSIEKAIVLYPALRALAHEFADVSDVRLVAANREVDEIMDSGPMATPFPDFSGNGPVYEDADVITLSVDASIGGEMDVNVSHPTQAAFALAGLDMPHDIPNLGLLPPALLESRDVFAYDYVIAPWSSPTGGYAETHERSLTHSEAWWLVNELGRQGTVAVLGAANDDYPWARNPGKPPAFAYEYGLALVDVIALMRSAKRAVITVDGDFSRLAHAAGIDNHVLLAVPHAPLQWQAHPKVHAVYAPAHQWRAGHVLQAIDDASSAKAVPA